MAKTTKQLLDDLSNEASDIRDDTSSVNSGIVRKGEVTEKPALEDEPEEQNIEKTEDEPDEETESKEEEDTQEAEEVEDEQPTARERNRENAQRRIINDLSKKNSDLEAKVEEFTKAKTASEQKEIGDEIKELATELKLDPDGLGKIFTKFESIIERRIQSKLPPTEIVNDFEERQEREYFDTEWSDTKVQGYIEKTYPNAGERQLLEAKNLLDEIAHSEDGGRVITENGKERLAGFPLDYIMWANKEEFDKILNTKKRHGLESANRASLEGNDDEQIDTSTSKGLDSLDKKYSQIAAGDSGLHRVRTSSRSI